VFLNPPWKKIEVDDQTRQDYAVRFISPFGKQMDGKEQEMYGIREWIKE